MRANTKTVVMATITKDKKTRVVPVAIFARAEQAVPFGRALRDAVKAGDEVRVTGLAFDTGIPATEWIDANLRLSVSTLRYCPLVEIAEDDPFAELVPATT